MTCVILRHISLLLSHEIKLWQHVTLSTSQPFFQLTKSSIEKKVEIIN